MLVWKFVEFFFLWKLMQSGLCKYSLRDGVPKPQLVGLSVTGVLHVVEGLVLQLAKSGTVAA